MHEFEFQGYDDFDFITDFARQFGFNIMDDLLVLPPDFGDGYIRKVDLTDGFILLIHHYSLKDDFVIKRKAAAKDSNLISIFFYNNDKVLDLHYNAEAPVPFSKTNPSAVQITSNDINSTIYFPAHTDIYFIVIGILAPQLTQLLRIKSPNKLFEKISSGAGAFVYFESMTKEMELLTKHLSEINTGNELSSFYFKIKVEELLYHLFDKLMQRENMAQQLVSNADAEKLLLVRSSLLADLSQPPLLKELARKVAMGETKLKHLFKQTFGDSIYNYYQTIRMEEAAFLLKQTDYSVSEVGYRLGLTNLSHFATLFKKHYGKAPKKYKSDG